MVQLIGKLVLFASFLIGAGAAQAQVNCSVACTPDCIRYAEQLIGRGQEILDLCGVTQPAGRVELYRSDDCRSDLLGFVDSMTNCEKFRTETNRVWAVRIGKDCMNITDAPAIDACYSFAAGANPRSIRLFRHDQCQSDELVAIVDNRTNCSMLGSVLGNKRVWGIMVSGKCLDITDSDLIPACDRYKSGRIEQLLQSGK